MGCSNGNDYINLNQYALIKLCLNIYKNEIIINNSIQESLDDDSKCKPKMYYLVNRFWKEDYLQFFNYNEIKNIIIELIGKEYPDVNIEEINAFSRDKKLVALLGDKKIQEQIKIIQDKIIINFPRELKAISHIKNNFITLNQEKEIFPDNNTTLLEKEIFDLMIRILNDSQDDKKIQREQLNKIFCSEVLLGNENIYIKIKDNEIIICFLENEKLRTKYFMYFKSKTNFEEIIKKHILNRSLENHIESKYDMDTISEHEMKDKNDNNKNIGFFLNLIPIDKDEINKRLQNQSLISAAENKEAPPLINNDNKINDININNNDKISLIEKNSENEIFSKKDDNISAKDNNESIFNNSNNLHENYFIKNNNNDNESMNLITKGNNEKNDNSSISNKENKDKNLIEDDNIKNSNNKIFRRIKKCECNALFNEVLQCLTNIEIIRDFFLGNQNKIIDDNKNFPNFCKRFIYTIKYVNNYDINENIFDDEFLKSNNFNSNNDIVSSISFLLNKFKEELKNLSLDINERCIDKFFYGQRNIECICQNCGTDFNNRQPFFYFKFDLQKIFKYYISQNDYIMNINLMDCFNYNFKFSEEISCNKCGSKNYKIKSYEISSLPDIIIIILERGFETPFKNKFVLESTSLVNDKEKTYYTLISQMGLNERKTLFTNLRSLDDLKWRECKENEIMDCSEEDVKNKVPYVLFYQKIQDLNKIKLIDEEDNSVILHENDNIDLVFYSTVTRIKEKLEHLDSSYTIEHIYNQILCKKYKFENKNKILFFSNSRKLDHSKSIRDNNLNNDDFVIIVEYNYF